MDHGLEKYRHLREYMDVAEVDLKKLLRMIDTLLEEVESYHNMKSSPELCLGIRDNALRVRSLLSSRLVALEDLIVLLRENGIRI